MKSSKVLIVIVCVMFVSACVDGTSVNPSENICISDSAQIENAITDKLPLPTEDLPPIVQPERSNGLKPVISASPNTDVSPNTDFSANADVSPNADNYYDSSEYINKLYSILDNELFYIFGYKEINYNLKGILDKFGTPIEIHSLEGEVLPSDAEYGIYVFSQGFELDIGSENDYQIVVNYLHFLPTCTLRFSNGVGIGSTYEELMELYKEEIDPTLSSESLIALGREVFFVMKNWKVNEFYINSGIVDYEYWYFIPG